MRISSNARILALVALVALVAAACDDHPKSQPLGDLELTTSAPTLELSTVDGWSIKLDRFLVHVSAVNVAGADRVVAATATPQIIDQVAPGPKPLLTASVRTARPWENVSFEIGPASATATLLDPVKETDRDMMQKEGLSFYIEAKATKDAVTKTLKLGFKTDTIYKSCEGDLNGARVPGLVVPTNGQDSADVVMDGAVLFSDDLSAPGAVLRADAIMAADTDDDGIVTLIELHAVPMQVVRLGGAPYLLGSHPEVLDLGAFVEQLTLKMVKTFREPTGKCIAAPVAATTP